MPPLLLLLLLLVIVGGVFGYMTYRAGAVKRAREKKRNQYHDRI